MDRTQETHTRRLHNTALRDKLRQTINNKEYRGPKPTMNIMGNVNRIGEEGKNHILLATASTDPVGKILAIDSEEPLYHDKLGYFRTFQGFWHYISTEERDDRLRELDGTKLENLVKNLTKVRIQNFNALVLDALYQRALKKKESIFLIKKSTLPFDHYRIFNEETGLRQRLGFSFWLIEGCEEIRNAIKADGVPDFSKYMNTRRTSLSDFIQKEFFDFIPPKAEVKADEKPAEKEEATTTQETPAAILVKAPSEQPGDAEDADQNQVQVQEDSVVAEDLGGVDPEIHDGPADEDFNAGRNENEAMTNSDMVHAGETEPDPKLTESPLKETTVVQEEAVAEVHPAHHHGHHHHG